MKHLTPIILLALLAVGGCKSADLATALNAHAGTLDGFTIARATGQITDKAQREGVAPLRETSKLALDLRYAQVTREAPPEPRLLDAKANDDRAVNANRLLDPKEGG